MKITVEVNINAPVEKVWSAWITPEDITKWNFASDDWCCPSAEMDLKTGGKFQSRMEAKDGSSGFDFEGVFTSVKEKESIVYKMGDGREVSVSFSKTGNGTVVTETFDAENTYPPEFQKQGWQSILNNFAKYTETKS